MMKKLILSLLILSLVLAVFGCGSKTDSKSLQITEKKMEADNFGNPVVTGKVKNSGKDKFNTVLVKVSFTDEDGKIIDDNYGMFGPVEAGKEISFTLKGGGDYYSVKSFNVWIDSAE